MPRLSALSALALIVIASGCANTPTADESSGRELGGKDYTWSAPVTLAGTIFQFYVGPDSELLATPDGVLFGKSELRPIRDNKIWVKNTASSKNRVAHFSPGTRVGVRHLPGRRAVIDLDQAQLKVDWSFESSEVLFEERIPTETGKPTVRWHFARTVVEVSPDGAATLEEPSGESRTLLRGSTVELPLPSPE